MLTMGDGPRSAIYLSNRGPVGFYQWGELSWKNELVTRLDCFPIRLVSPHLPDVIALADAA
jgi:hypothetical protein